jgi:outer membrane protein OmpA-like peptidoglycan-associated protein
MRVRVAPLWLLLGVAWAGPPERGVELAVDGGAQLALTNRGLLDADTAHFDDAGGHGGLFGLRVGGLVLPWLQVDALARLTPYAAGDAGPNLAVGGAAEVLWVATALGGVAGPVRWDPLVAVGLGLDHNLDGDLGRDTDLVARYGVGLRALLSRDWALRIDLRHGVTDGDSGRDLGHLLQITAGLGAFFGVAAKGPAVRIVDRTDADGDRIVDALDECPDVPGPARAKGCPAPPPDQDGDKLVDAVDACPDTPGPAHSDGCPAPPPDRDGDQVVDALDACPDTPGRSDHAGCPPPVSVVVVEAPSEDGGGAAVPLILAPGRMVDTIYFETASERPDPVGLAVLSRLAAVLQAHPEIPSVLLEGFADPRGDPDVNLGLSQLRADQVRTLLMDLGVPPGRVRTSAQGEARPFLDSRGQVDHHRSRRVEISVPR